MRRILLSLLAVAVALTAAVAAGDNLDPTWVGIWQNVSPDSKNPQIQWKSTFTVDVNGHYALDVAAGTKTLPTVIGQLQASNGKFLATPVSGGKASSGMYRFVGGAMKVTYSSGKNLTWTRPTVAVARPSASRRSAAESPVPAAPVGPSPRQLELDAITATPLPPNLRTADAKTLLLSDFPLPPADDEADLFCLPVLGQIAGSGMRARQFRTIR